MVKPVDVKYKVLAYPDANTKLQADLDGNVDSESIGTGDFRALSLEFSLPSGSYATVALREITRLSFRDNIYLEMQLSIFLSLRLV